MKVQKKTLNQEKISFIKKFLDDKYPNADKEKCWKECVNAINKKLSSLRDDSSNKTKLKSMIEHDLSSLKQLI